MFENYYSALLDDPNDDKPVLNAEKHDCRQRISTEAGAKERDIKFMWEDPDLYNCPSFDLFSLFSVDSKFRHFFEYHLVLFY